MHACLESVQRSVPAAGVDQIIMRAIFDDAAAIKRYDPVRSPYRRKPVLHAQRRKRQRKLFNIQRPELAHAVFDLRHCFFFGNDRDVHGKFKRERPHAQ
jgi:hypothetical protein